MTTTVWRPLLRALALTSGRAAAQRALPIYFGVLLVYSVLFEGNGVRPADVVLSALESRGVRFLAFGAWTVVSLPALRAVLTTPASFFLRALPLPRWRLLLAHAGFLLLAELPWAYVWLRGGGPGVGLAAILTALALGTLLLCGLGRPREHVAALALAGVLTLQPLTLQAWWPLWLGVGAAASAIGIYGAWLRAPRLSPPRSAARIGGPPTLALSASYALGLWRQARAQCSRALGFLLLALLAGYYGVRNTRPPSPAELVALATLLGSPAWILGAAGLAGPLLRAEAQLAWLVRVCGTSRASAEAAPRAVLGLAGAGSGLLYAWALGELLGAPPALRLALCGAATGAGALGALWALLVARWALRGDGGDAGRLFLGVGLLLLGAVLSLARWGPGAAGGGGGWAALAQLARPGSQKGGPCVVARLDR